MEHKRQGCLCKLIRHLGGQCGQARAWSLSAILGLGDVFMTQHAAMPVVTGSGGVVFAPQGASGSCRPDKRARRRCWRAGPGWQPTGNCRRLFLETTQSWYFRTYDYKSPGNLMLNKSWPPLDPPGRHPPALEHPSSTRPRCSSLSRQRATSRSHWWRMSVTRHLPRRRLPT